MHQWRCVFQEPDSRNITKYYLIILFGHVQYAIMASAFATQVSAAQDASLVRFLPFHCPFSLISHHFSNIFFPLHHSESVIIPNGRPLQVQIRENDFLVYHSFASLGSRLLVEVSQFNGHRLDVLVNPDSPPTLTEWYMAGTQNIREFEVVNATNLTF